MTRCDVLMLLALAPLISEALRERRRVRGSSPWNNNVCGAAPAASNGLQYICTEYRANYYEGEHLWIRGFKSEQATNGCYIFLYGSKNDFTPGQPHEPQLYAPFFTREMANEGYCAVQVEYLKNKVSEFPSLPGQVRGKARDIYGDDPDSVLS